MSNLYFGITRYGYDICNEISDMACFSLNLKTAVDFNAEARRRKVTQRKSEVM